MFYLNFEVIDKDKRFGRKTFFAASLFKFLFRYLVIRCCRRFPELFVSRPLMSSFTFFTLGKAWRNFTQVLILIHSVSEKKMLMKANI